MNENVQSECLLMKQTQNIFHCEMEGLNATSSETKYQEKSSCNMGDLWGYTGCSEDVWNENSSRSSTNLQVPETTVNEEAFSLDLADDETLLSFLSVEENGENECFIDSINETGTVEMSSANLDSILSNTVNQIFSKDDKGKESTNTFNQSDNMGNTMHASFHKVGQYTSIKDDSLSSSVKVSNDIDFSSKESSMTSNLGKDGSGAMMSLLLDTSFEKITHFFPEEKPLHLIDTCKSQEDCEGLEGKDASQQKNVFPDLDNEKVEILAFQDLIPEDRGSFSFQQSPGYISSIHKEELQVGDSRWQFVEEAEAQKSRTTDQVTDFLEDCFDNLECIPLESEECHETIFVTNQSRQHLKEQGKMDYIFMNETSGSPYIFSNIQFGFGMPSDAEILQPSKPIGGNSLSNHLLNQKSCELDLELISSVLPQTSQSNVLQGLEAKNTLTEVKETLKNQSVLVNGSSNWSGVSDVVWTMQRPKPSISPLQINTNYIHCSEDRTSSDLVNVSKMPELVGEIDNVTAVDEWNLARQDIPGAKHIMEKRKAKNASHLIYEGFIQNEGDKFCTDKFEIHADDSQPQSPCNQNLKRRFYETEDLSGTSRQTSMESLVLSSEQVETATFVDHTSDIDSIFDNSTPSSQFLLPDEGPSFQVPQEIGVSGSQSVAAEANVMNSEFSVKASKCSELGEVSSNVTHKLSSKPCYLGFQNASCNMNEFDTLLDSFMYDIENKCSNPNTSIKDTSTPNDFMLAAEDSNTADERLDNFFNELDGERDVLIAGSSNPFYDKQEDIIPAINALGDSSAQLISPEKKAAKSTIFQVHSAGQKSRKNNTKGKRFKGNASFKIQSTGKPIKCIVRGQVVENVSQKRLRTLRFVLDKERRLENQDGTGVWPQREDFNPDKFSLSQGADITSPAKKEVSNRCVLENNLVPQAPLGTNVDSVEVFESSSFVLPVGETGLSVTIPTNTPTSITSFFPVSSPGCIAKLTPILPSQYNKTIDKKNPMLTHPQVCTLLPYVPEKGNNTLHSQNGTPMIVPNSLVSVSRTKAVLQVSLSTVTSVEPLYVVVPTITHTKNAYNTPVVTGVSSPPVPQAFLNNSKWQNQTSSKLQSSWSSHMHPIAPKISQTSVSSSPPVKVPLGHVTSNVLHPVKIFVTTKSKPVAATIPKNSCMELSSKRPYVDEPRLKSEFVQSLQQNILKRKPHPDLVHKKFSHVLRDELRIRFPDIPEPILSRLNIPPQAVHRGYFSVLDLQTLRAQALALRLRIIFREHVSKCVARNCIVCLDFLKERQKLSWVERERHLGPRILRKGRNAGSSGRGRARGKRGGRVRGSRLRERDDPTYEPPHSYVNSKKRKNESEVNSIVLDGKAGNPRKMCVKDCDNPFGVLKRFHRGKILYDYSKLRSCYSETNIYVLSKSYDFIDDKLQTSDDLYLAHYQNRPSLKCFQNEQDKKVHLVLQNSSKGKLNIRSIKNMYIYDQKDRESQQLEMLKEAFYDLSVKQLVEKESCIPFSEGDTIFLKGTSIKPLYYDLHSLIIGPLKVSAKYDREILPKLRVIFTARKFTYEYELMCGMSRNHEPDPCKVRSVSGKPHPQLLLTIDIPFKTIQALSIQSNKVSLLVKTVPYIQVVARRGLSRVAVPEKNALSQAQRKYFARVKAVLTIFPLHQLMLADQGRAASLCDGLCGFASWFKTCLLQQLPVPEGHIPSWCLTPHLDPDVLARKLSQHAAQGYVEATRRSTCIVRDSVSGKYFGKIVDKSDQPPDHQSSSKADQPDSNGNCKLGNFKALDVVQDIMASDEVKCSQKAEKANSSGSPLTGSRRGSIKDDTPNSRVATLYDDCVDNADKQKTTVASRKQIEITNSVEDSAAFYLLSGVRSALSSQKNARSPPFSTGLRFPPPYLEKGCTCKENCHQMECPCARGGVLCQAGQTCSCQSCDNPLNVLHILNLDIHTARIDECLMQNLYSLDITELCKLLVSRVVLPCCRNTTELLHIIPGTILCNFCSSTVSYSWCTNYVHLQSMYPRNHCLACCYCRPTLHTHCQNCLHCTPSTGQGTCLECGAPKPFGV